MDATQALADFIVGAPHGCPPDLTEAAQRAIFDTLGVMIAGTEDAAAQLLLRLALAEGGTPTTALVGAPHRTSPTWAALVNGTAGHGLDFDDTNFVMMGHPSNPVLAAALATARPGTPGTTLLRAFAVGFEMEATMGELANPAQYRRGFHSTGTIGALGAAAAAAIMLGLDRTQTRNGLAIVASLASGLKENFGSMVKPLHAGHAARNGVFAMLLAQGGFDGAATAIDGKQGYLQTLGTNGLDPRGPLERLGRPWKLVSSSVAVKPYACCAIIHSTIDATLKLHQEGLRPADVEKVVVGVAAGVPDIIMHHDPTTAHEARFSAEYCVAAALHDGGMNLASFTDAQVNRPAIRAFVKQISLAIDPTIPPDREHHAWTRLTVTTRGGQTLEVAPEPVRGHPIRPLSWDELTLKFRDCTSRLPAGQAEELARRLRDLAAVDDLDALVRLTQPET